MNRAQIIIVWLCLLTLATAAEGQTGRQPPNVLLLCVDDLRPELNCYGAEYIYSPNIDRLSAQGHTFHKHFVQAPTCGASRFALLTGRYGGTSNNALFQRARRLASGGQVSPSLPAWFRQHGYRTISVGKVSHHPGGRGGADWNDDSILEMPNAWDRSLMPAGLWQNPRGWMHGLANGEIRRKASDMDVYQSVDGPDEIYPDGVVVQQALTELDEWSKQPGQPLFLAIGLLRPHLPFGAPAKYLNRYLQVQLPPIPHPTRPQSRTTWHRSGEFMKYNRWDRDPNQDLDFANQVRRHYAACVSYADAQVGKILDRLDQTTARDNTIVILWGDHGWHLGEHAIWGKHSLFEESLQAPLIIHFPALDRPGADIQAVVESIDIYPTLCDLAGLPTPDLPTARSLIPLLNGQPSWPNPAAISYTGQAKTIRTDTHRLIMHGDGFVELYDHQADSDETQNIASQFPDIVKRLDSQMNTELRSSDQER